MGDGFVIGVLTFAATLAVITGALVIEGRREHITIKEG